MWNLVKKVSWFEWIALTALITVGVLCYRAVSTLWHNAIQVEVLQLEKRQQQGQLEIEQASQSITDLVVYNYSVDRELKIAEFEAAKTRTVTDYFASKPTTPKPFVEEVTHEAAVPVKEATAQPVRTPLSGTDPDRVAVAVLARGMHDTYCRAYPEGSSCTANTTKKRLHP